MTDLEHGSATPEYAVRIPVDEATAEGTLVVPTGARGTVIFAHGTGSSRHSPRNRFVAETLQQRGLSTLLLDLLTSHEERIDEASGALRFNIEFLATRLTAATDWVRRQPLIADLPVGYFGASTGAAAALAAAASRRGVISAIVSRGGRPDLAGEALTVVEAPTLLIVGGADETVVELNQRALLRMHKSRTRELAIVPRATHLFEEPGALEDVARLASEWFARYLAASPEPLPSQSL